MLISRDGIGWKVKLTVKLDDHVIWLQPIKVYMNEISVRIVHFNCISIVLTKNSSTISDKNNWHSLYFHKKVYKKTLDLLKVTQNSPYPWLDIVPSLKKTCQAEEIRNEQTDLQPTLNKGGGGASLTIFVTDCLQK